MTEDSDRLRRRLAHKIHDLATWDFIKAIRAETGHDISSNSTSKTWLEFIGSIEVDDLLDLLTVAVHALAKVGEDENAIDLLTFIQRAMDEENVSFEMDELGGIHYRVDAAFQSSKRAALDVLELGTSKAALEAFVEAHQALTSHPRNTLTAVRRAFDAVENLFKMRFDTSRLGASEIKAKLKAAGDCEDSTAANTVGRLNAAFAEWVNACHQYRHAAGQPQPSAPPVWLATTLVDSASTYIRYLAALRTP